VVWYSNDVTYSNNGKEQERLVVVIAMDVRMWKVQKDFLENLEMIDFLDSWWCAWVTLKTVFTTLKP